MSILSHQSRAWLGRGLVATGLDRLVRGEIGVVVAFHRVTDAIPEDGITKGSRDFERFCRFFRDHFDVISLDDFVGRLERKASVAGTLAITFDDGYLDNFEIAAPILRKLSLPATFFLVSGFLGTTIVPWWDRGLSPQPAWMSWDQARALAAEGFDIGAHTRTHVDLGVIAGGEAREEIAGSRSDLAREIGKVPVHFAFPYGQPGNLLGENRELIAESGFRSCVSCHGGLATGGTHPLHLPRVPINPWMRTPDQFAFEVLTRRA
jgi:peptidoglycan/xylan/chitin deacetylase (PgdA/CDA1 family)